MNDQDDGQSTAAPGAEELAIRLDLLFVEARAAGEELEKRETNYGKEPKKRKSEQKIREYGKSLTNLWQLFEGFNGEIEKLATDKSVAYFTDNYYGFVKNIYSRFRAKIESDLPSAFEEISPRGSEENVQPSGVEEVKKIMYERRGKLALLDNFLKKLSSTNFDECAMVEDLEFRLKQCEKYFDSFTTAHTSVICQAIEAGECLKLNKEFSEYEDKFQTMAVALESKISLRRKLEEERGSSSFETTHDTSFRSSYSSHNHNSNVKLPKLEIPKFDGDCTNWPEFRDLFSSLIHEKNSVPNVQKMQYLKMNLTGSAANVIKHLQVNGDHYNDAWAALNKRYNNKKLLINNNLKRLLSQRYVKAENADELRQLLDTTKEIICTLKNLGEPTEKWNSVVVFVIAQRLPTETAALWENQTARNESIPLLEELEIFLENRFRTIEMIEKRAAYKSNQFNANKRNFNKVEYKCNVVENKNDNENKNSRKCPMCNHDHSIFSCHAFNQLLPMQRLEQVKKLRLCTLCLQAHPFKECKSNWSCFKCHKKHNTVLHIEQNTDNATATHVANARVSNAHVVLATAMIRVKASNGQYMHCRALIDQGSMTSIVTEHIAHRLQLVRQRDDSQICGISGNAAKTKGRSVIEFTSRFDDEKNSFKSDVVILPKITSWVPSECLHLREHYSHMKLADPNFDMPGNIDVLLGADVYRELILNDIQKDVLLAQDTVIGWILSGKIEGTNRPIISQIHTATLEKQMEKFWEIEEKQIQPKWTTEESECEEFYARTTKRGSDGRYVVRLPFKREREKLGRTRHIAVSNLLKLEKKFKQSPELKERYKNCILDYLQSGHAVPVHKTENYFLRKNGEEQSYDCFYLPHLAVVKEQSTSTKTRVVFNASSKSSNGVSLNDTLLIGPTIQYDVIDKINRFRIRKYAFICDVTKMYRQIKMSEDDWQYQRFVWRDNEDDPIQEFSLSTVVFGEASAPFSAIRTVQQIATDYQESYPLAAEILLDNSYVDDLHQNKDTIKEAIDSRDELTYVMRSAGMELSKWASNCSEILDGMPSDRLEKGTQLAINSSDLSVKTLGLYWDPSNDCFQYNCPMDEQETTTSTKRELLTSIAKIYDPMGWAQPLIIKAKVLMQETWKLKLDWDELLPTELNEKWNECRNQLREIESFKIPRWIGYSDADKRIELHGFSDASQSAYGAIIYAKILHGDGEASIHLLIAKSRVTPLKLVTIPRLELCAAALLSGLFTKVVNAMKLEQVQMYGWTDSQIVLAWLKSPSPDRWKAFVRNKVVEICNVVDKEKWNYVNTKENPADIISRGCSSADLTSSKLWWNGPEWLPSWVPSTDDTEFETVEEKKEKPVICNIGVPELSIVHKYSSFARLNRVIGWIYRFANNCRSQSKNYKKYLTISEINAGKEAAVKLIQAEAFSVDIASLKTYGQVDKKSKLASLSPIIDDKGIMRVGGRLENANIPCESKHPIILPHNHSATHALISDAHKSTLHGGKNLTLCAIRAEFWITHGTKTVKAILSKCVRCLRNKPQLQHQLMGQLPPSRVNFSKAFSHTGVDFAGPISIKTRTGRGAKAIKAYIAIFVCMAIKAIHLELVGSLTAPAFIAALKRVIARRGTISDMYSDNATNFLGAIRKLLREWKVHEIDAEAFCSQTEEFLSFQKITWHFIPSASPSFGGLWEAGVRSVKYHLRRTIGNSIFTYEEMATVLTQIESVLNSRPLCRLSDNIEDLDALTPNHFLTGQRLVPLPETCYISVKDHLLTRWQLCQKATQEMCARYKSEYLHRLQQRPKWLKTYPNIEVGQLFLIKDENKYVNNWNLGRVVQTHPGADGLVRVVTLKTKSGLLKRPITKLSPLPLEPSHDEADESPNPAPDGEVVPLRRSARLQNKQSALFTILMCLYFAAVAFGHSNWTISRFAHPSGIHFMPEGNAYFIEGYWDLTIQHSTHDYESSIIQINNSIISLESECNNNIFDCTSRVQLLRQENQSMRRKFEQMVRLANGRQKRMPPLIIAAGVALVGAAVTTLYANYVTKSMEHDLNQLRDDHLQLQKFLINQTSALEDLASIEDSLESRVNEMDILLHNANIAITKLKYQQQFQDILHDIQSEIRYFDSLYRLTSDILIHRKSLLPVQSVLNITDLDQHLDKISQNLAGNLRIPSYIIPSEVLTYPSVNSNKNFIQFAFKIPIILKDRARLYRLIPVPIVQKDKMYWIDPNSEYVAILKLNSTDKFFGINLDKQCTLIGSAYICKTSHFASDNNMELTCIASLYSNHTLPETCSIHTTRAAETWIPIENNIWAFVIPKYNQKLNLTGSGLLTTDTDVHFSNSNNSVLITDNTRVTWSISSPHWNISCLIDQRPEIHQTQFHAATREKLDHLHAKIDSLKELQSKTLSAHDLHHYTAPYILFVALGILLLIRKMKKKSVDHSRFFVHISK